MGFSYDSKPFFTVLAPMAGVTDFAYRRICKRFGCDLTITEMVSAKGLFYGSERTGFLLETSEEERPCAAQIFGSDPALMADMAERIEDTHNGELCAIDINMGCPAPKITSNGDGSALMKDLALAGRIISAVSSRVKLPVSVKFRKGWDEHSVNALEFARMAEENGAKLLALHGRTRAQMYSGKADWDIIGEVKSSVRIPVVGNGDVFSASDALRLVAHTGCDGVMIGRGAQGNPWIFEQIDAVLRGGTPREPSADDRLSLAIEHVRSEQERYGEHAAARMRKHVAWYITGLPGAARLRVLSNECAGVEALVGLLVQYRERLRESLDKRGEFSL